MARKSKCYTQQCNKINYLRLKAQLDLDTRSTIIIRTYQQLKHQFKNRKPWITRFFSFLIDADHTTQRYTNGILHASLHATLHINSWILDTTLLLLLIDVNQIKI